MKRLLLATGLLWCGYAFGQAKDGTAELQKSAALQPAAVIYLPYSPATVKKALTNYLSRTGEKAQKNAEGFLLFENTAIANDNTGFADMHFVIGLKNGNNNDESAVFLKLHSSTQSESNSAITAYEFGMQDAKDFLDNFALAIKAYASRLQMTQQQKTLYRAEDKSRSLVSEGTKLEDKRKKMQLQMAAKKNVAQAARLQKKIADNLVLISQNLAVRLSLDNQILKQRAALALLKL